MANELPYFRFTVSAWQNGKIEIESYHLKGLFISICGYYWLQDCSLSLEILKKKFRGCENDIEELIKLLIIKHNKKSDFIEIAFLNEQFDTLSEKRKLRQEAGKRGGKQKSSNAKAMLKQNPSYKDKDKENNKDKDKSKNFTPPNLLEVTDYFIENGYTKESGIKAFNYYNSANWHDSTGKKIKNWKQKMQGVWFKEENKVQEQAKRKLVL